MAGSTTDCIAELSKLMDDCFDSLRQSVETAVIHYNDVQLKEQFGKECLELLDSYAKIGQKTEKILKTVKPTMADFVQKELEKYDENDNTGDDENEEGGPSEQESEEEEIEVNIDDEELKGYEELNPTDIDCSIRESDAEVATDGGGVSTQENMEAEEDSEEIGENCIPDIIELDIESLFLKECAKIDDSGFKKFCKYKEFKRQIMDILTTEQAVVMQASENLTDPITKKRMKNPMKNKICGHSYDKESIKLYIGKKSSVPCPWYGCKCKAFNMKDLVENTQLALKIQNESTEDEKSLQDDDTEIVKNSMEVKKDESDEEDL